MNWSELVGTKVQLPPPNHEATAAQLASIEPPAPAATKSSRSTKAASSVNRENPLFAGSSDQSEVPTASPTQLAYSTPATVSSLLTVPTLMNLTFATTVITLLWKLLQRWFGTAAGQWVPLLCCLLFVGISWLVSYANARTNVTTKLVTAFVAVLTGFILTAAVIGIDVAVLRPAP